MSEWLKSLKAGNVVVRAHGYGRLSERLMAVESTTATIVRIRISANHVEEYNRETGRLRGHKGLDTVRIDEATTAARGRIRAAALSSRLSMVNWAAFPVDVLEQVAALIGKAD